MSSESKLNGGSSETEFTGGYILASFKQIDDRINLVQLLRYETVIPTALEVSILDSIQSLVVAARHKPTVALG
jgi:hypothetical protein